MKMDLVDKVREVRSNLGHNLKQHWVEYTLITAMIPGFVGAVSCSGYSEEDMQKYAQQYAAEQQQKAAQQQKAQADEAQLKKNTADIDYVKTQLGEYTTKIGNLDKKIDAQTGVLDKKITDQTEVLNKRIDAQTGVLDKKITDQTEVLKKSINDALKQYSENQTQQDTFYFSPRSVEELVNASRYNFPRDVVERMQRWPGNYGYGGFQSTFPFVQPQWLDGYIGNGEFVYGTALHVDKIAGLSRAYLTNGERPASGISVLAVENLLQNYFGQNPQELSRVTIQIR